MNCLLTLPYPYIGFGTYRIEGRRPEHAEAIKQALLGGINLIDTSANYGDGDSEIQIGEVLRELTEGGQINRNEVLLVSKFGYIQGQNLKRYNSGEVVTPDTVHYADYIKHCIHPDFMRDQLDRSLERLDQDRIDIFLLHNPEYYLHFEVRGEMDEATMDGHRQEMQRRIYEAFKALELEVDAGRIRSYGISSNSFSLAPSDPHFLQYDNLLDLAAEVGKVVSPHDFLAWQLVHQTNHALSLHSFTHAQHRHPRKFTIQPMHLIISQPSNSLLISWNKKDYMAQWNGLDKTVLMSWSIDPSMLSMINLIFV